MAIQPITVIDSHYAVLPIDNVDTDQIIPARFLKGTSRQGLGVHAFSDWRYLPDGTPNPAFVLNQPQFAGVQVLVAGDNFGCGSSREHAPWSLVDMGLKAVISTSIADIFRNNALKNGLLPLEVDSVFHRHLTAAPGAAIHIDVAAGRIQACGHTATFQLDPFARYRLLNGIDELDFLLREDAAISGYERSRASWMR